MINVDLLKRTIQYRGLTQMEVAKELGMSRTALQMRMRRQNFSVLIVQRLADILSLDFDEMGEIFFPDMM